VPIRWDVSVALTLDMGIHIRAPREFVFQHLLTPHHLARWFCNFAQFDPRGPAVGTKFRFGGDYAIAATEPPGWPCDILSGEVLRSVSFRWPLFGADTRVDWRAEDGSEGSVFRVAHSEVPREDSTCGRFHDAWRVCLGNLKAVAEARDDSLRPDSSPIGDGMFRLNLVIGASPSKVFNALVDPTIMSKATGGSRVGIVPRAGGTYEIFGSGAGPASIELVEPGRRLVLSWPIAGAPRRLTVDLEDKGGDRSGVYLRYDRVPDNAALRVRCRWSDLLVGLKNVLETGETGFTEPYEAQSRTG